ncbi:MAG: VOC family protein [Chloroflexi bacterium AL-W]|nr:VOC family protein [Chloroflexi bacterium AL-N1]NOK71388.1 VOC family protein [Chloroflexi bacterium AL-N10]NOK78791.1 VOC family protein [Chloroflexi bacterium AL-N5]NOK86161.1 VOC family protein [Chloroflexi bacterium AL-W]NOK93114.1 VOC family protein [Chloroflexi bacterium AL-N15]
MRITLTSVPVQDQAKALMFYTDILGFIKKQEIPLGDALWLTVVSPEDSDGVELLLEPNGNYPAMKELKAALVADGIPFTAFQVNDIYAEYSRLKELGVAFMIEPTDMGTTTAAIFDDTCGNLIQLYQLTEA